MLEVKYDALSEIGKVRSHNEDAYLVDEHTPNGKVYVVCDGMGGHVGGAIASSLAAKSVIEYFQRQAYDNLILEIYNAMQFANEQIFVRTLAEPSLKGMGTTAVVLIIKNDDCFIGHVGDSRIYLKTENKLHRLTKDHSFVQTLVDSGAITDDEAERHPQKNQILKALGHSPEVKATVCQSPIKVQANDVFMLCSDGLNGMINDTVIEESINYNDIGSSTQALYSRAMENGGADNITLLLVKVEKSSHYKHSVFQSFNPKKEKSYADYDRHSETNAIPSISQSRPVYVKRKNNKNTIILASLIGVLLIVSGILGYDKIFGDKGAADSEKDGTTVENFYDKSALESKTYADLIELSKSKPAVALVNGDEIDSKDNKKVKLTVDDSGKLVAVSEAKTIVIVQGPDNEPPGPGNTKKDSDGDGFPDKVDRCPNLAGKNNGCPENANPVPPACAAKGLSFSGGFYYFKAAASGTETSSQFVNRVKTALGACGLACNGLDVSQIDTYNKDKFNVEGGRTKSTLKKGASIKFKCN